MQDFDFLFGSWSVRHRRLQLRGQGCDQWEEYIGSAETRPLLDGLCNIEEHRIPGRSFSGVALRTFNPADRLWSIFWISATDGVLQPPVTGSFDGVNGRFEGNDVDSGRPVRVRFVWQRDETAPRWRQSFSYDDGKTWETNWTMEFSRRP